MVLWILSTVAALATGGGLILIILMLIMDGRRKKKNRAAFSKGDGIMRRVAVTAFALVFLCSSAYVLTYYVRQSKAGNDYAMIQEESRLPEKAALEEVALVEKASEAPVPEQEEEPFVSKIDFATLKQENEDIYAWIDIPGTVIDYPILQHPTELEYYLEHTVTGAEGLPGSIYTEHYNDKGFTDFNTVIYGHNMRNGSMFGGLHKFEDEGFLQENSVVNIYLPDKTLTYQIFAAVTWDDHRVLDKYGFFKTDSDKEAFLADVASTEQGNDLEVTTDSNIITLATCMNGNLPHNRWLVMAVLVE